MLRKSDIQTSSFLFLKILLPPKSREEPTYYLVYNPILSCLIKLINYSALLNTTTVPRDDGKVKCGKSTTKDLPFWRFQILIIPTK